MNEGFEKFEKYAENTKDEVLITFVSAVKEICISPVMTLTKDMIKKAFATIVNASDNMSMENPRFKFFWIQGNRLTRIIDGDLRRAVGLKNNVWIHLQQQDIYKTVEGMIHYYP